MKTVDFIVASRGWEKLVGVWRVDKFKGEVEGMWEDTFLA